MATSGTVTAITRYPVKSMRGEALAEAVVALHGIPGDRQYAFVRDGDTSVFPWLTAKRLPALVTYQPVWEVVEGAAARLRVIGAGGVVWAVDDPGLAAELGRLGKHAVHLHADYRGNQDVAYISVISTATIRALCEAGGVAVDQRRFRMNLVVDLGDEPFAEMAWVGRTVTAGEATFVVTEPDARCQSLNLDPETGASTPAVLKAAGELNKVCAGVYASVARGGRVAVGDACMLGLSPTH